MRNVVARIIAGLVAALLHFPAYGSGLPVTAAHPRLLLTSDTIARLQGKMSAGDPSWAMLQSEADTLAGYTIFPYEYAQRTREPARTIFYDYEGEGWFTAAMPLAMAYRITGDAKYSAPLIALAQEMVRAESDPANLPPNGLPPIAVDNYYPSRFLGPAIAVIYDWCYDQLDPGLKAQIVTLMNAYYDAVRTRAYQVDDPPDGNYFIGHMTGIALMGYASFGDNPRAQEMIDWARMRLDGTPSTLVDPKDNAVEWVAEAFSGGIKPAIATGYRGPDVEGAPWRGGFDFQGWAYGTGSRNRLFDYLLAVESATGEDLPSVHRHWFEETFLALRHGLMSDNFKIVPSGDWGSDWGAVIDRSLPLRLALLLEGTAHYGPGAQYLAYTQIPAHSIYPDDYPDYGYQQVNQPAAWEEFFYGDTGRPAAPMRLPPYYSGFDPNDGATRRAIPYFYVRQDWSAEASWAFLHLGAAWYNDHQHNDAGTMILSRGGDQLLVDASNWKSAPGASEGIYGSSFDETAGPACAANTLYFNDFGDFQRSDDARNGSPYYCGGQGIWGEDNVLAGEQTEAYSFLRTDLSTAYNNDSDPATQAGRRLVAFLRTVVYLRPADVFLVYDQVTAAASTNPLGQYPKALRWHFPRQPALTRDGARVDHNQSRLHLKTLLPHKPALSLVDESRNPDPCDGSQPNCTTYAKAGTDLDSQTWRLEVTDPSGALATEFLTLLQPGALSRPAADAAPLSSRGGTMRGARIVQKDRVDIVLINTGVQPLAKASYRFSGPPATHTLGGMVPSAAYRVDTAGSTIAVTQNPAGTVAASPQGVLQFTQ